MKKEVSPVVIVVAIVIAVLLVGAFAYRTLAPHPPEATIPPPDQMSEGAIKRRNIEKAQGGQQGAATAQPAESRTGD